MPNSRENIKPHSQLTYDDFQQHPVWTWYETDLDESLVMSVDITKPFAKDEYGVLFILAELELHDGTKMTGEISVNLMNKTVYNLIFYQKGERFLFTGKRLIPLGTLQQLSEWIQKPIKAITPIKYITPFFFEDGDMITGEIELQDW